MAMMAAARALLALMEAAEVVKKGTAAVETHDTDIKPFHSNLAPCYGSLKESSSLKDMDDQLKIIIAGTSNKLGMLVEQAQNTNKLPEWDAIIEDMQSNTLLEPMDNSTVTRSDKLIKDDMNYFKFDGSPSKAVVEQVHSWFVALINDDDVLQDTLINIDALGAVVAETGARITDFSTFFYKHTLQESTVMDIGVLRYPDIDHPYFKVYRIQLTAWADCTRIVFVQHDANGITGNFNSRKYQPRASVMAGLSEDVKKKAIDEAEDLFD